MSMWFNCELYYFIFDLFLACMDHLLNAVSLLDPCKCDLVAQWRLISLLLYTRYYFTFVASFCVKVKCVLAALTHRQCTDSNFVMEERVKSSLLLYTILLLYYCPSRLALHVQFVTCKARSNWFMSFLVVFTW